MIYKLFWLSWAVWGISPHLAQKINVFIEVVHTSQEQVILNVVFLDLYLITVYELIFDLFMHLPLQFVIKFLYRLYLNKNLSKLNIFECGILYESNSRFCLY